MPQIDLFIFATFSKELHSYACKNTGMIIIQKYQIKSISIQRSLTLNYIGCMYIMQESLTQKNLHCIMALHCIMQASNSKREARLPQPHAVHATIGIRRE